MNAKAVSVILPAYSCEKFIGKAIQSVLQQTLSDFELIIINDGSSDSTESIIRSFQDERIVYRKNSDNKGLIYSLNLAIDLAQGKYIARMDADDICMPERLVKQKDFLDKNEEIAVIASTVDLINDKEEKNVTWKLDRQTISPEQIKKAMLKENCIAHPTVMMRSEIIKKFKYKPYQKNIEDYDLWLRMLNRGYKIAKIEQPLLLYRVHHDSVTAIHLKNKNLFFKHVVMKWKLLWHETLSGNLSGYTFLIKWFAIIDLVKGIGKALKNIFSR